jgi:hypothetical protein
MQPPNIATHYIPNWTGSATRGIPKRNQKFVLV